MLDGHEAMVEATQVRDVLRSWGWDAPTWSPTAEYALAFRVAPARFHRTVAQRLLARGDWRPVPTLRCTSQTYKRPGELRHKAKYETDEPFDLLLLGREPITPEIEQTLRAVGPSGRRRATNTFQMFQTLTHKDRLTRHLYAWAGGHGVDVDGFFPRSFLVAPRAAGLAPAEHLEDQREALCEADEKLRADGQTVVWITKEAFGCRGRRMLVSDRVERVLEYVDGHHVGEQGTCWVVQRYIHRPLLLHERKFDIRCWVAIDAQLHVHAWRQFSGRIASEPYRLVDLENSFVHLTNPFVQKRHPEFGSVAHGNELLFDELAAQLASIDRGIELERDIVAPMHAIISQTIAAARREPPPDYDGMQILGYDFMFDEDRRCHLLEVNFSPSAGRSLERLVGDFIEVTIDPLFPPARPQPPRHDNAFVRIDV
jgi:hypothetical protein